MGQAVSGIDGTVVSGSTDMDVTGFSADIEVEELDTTTTADAGWEDAIDGNRKVTGSFDFLYNPAKSPFSALANLLPGSGVYPTLTLKLTTGQVMTGVAKVNKLSLKSEVKGSVKKFTASFRSKGAWAMPS